MPANPVTIHIEGVPRAAITDALVAIERADLTIFDDEQHERLATLVLGLRAATDA